jgi:hypothetical protein
MVQAGAFPRPVRITERNRGYLLDDVQAWMQARLEASLPPSREPVLLQLQVQARVPPARPAEVRRLARRRG